MKLSQQAVGALLMTLQKCLAEQIDITELLADWDLRIEFIIFKYRYIV